MNEFGKALQKARKARGLRQSDLAKRIGVTQQNVSEWEKGNYSPKFPSLVALSVELDISLDELFEKMIKAYCIEKRRRGNGYSKTMEEDIF